MMRFLMAAAMIGATAGCANVPPPSSATEADDAACIAQGDAVYNANTLDQQGRTSQNGLLYGATPNHVFDAEQLGAEHVRDSDITNCEQNGNDSGAANPASSPAAATPHIVGTP